MGCACLRSAMRAALLILVLGGCADPGADPVTAADAAPDAARDGAVAPPACEDDRFGFGTEALPATRLAPGESAALVVCPPDLDWVRVDAPAGQAVAVVVEADRPVLLHLGATRSSPGRQAIVRGAVPPGGAVVGVEAVDAAAAVPYRLTVSTAVADCADALEPDDTADQASALAGALEAVVCAGGRDLFVVEGEPGAVVRVEAQRIAGQGIALATVAPFDDGVVPVERADGDVTPVLERRLDSTGRALFMVEPAGAGGRYRISARVTTTDAPIVEHSGVVRAPDRLLTADELGPPTYQPAADVLVDALVDGALVAVTRTDAAGRWQLAVPTPVGARVDLRVRASVWSAGKLIEVGPVLDRPWAESVADGVVEIDATGAAGPALHVALTAADGIAGLAPFLSLQRRPPPLRVVWTPGGASGCGTCYRPASDHVELSGRVTDPDEWDDAVILHELAHHLAVHHGRDDSPGGAHDGGPVAPALAWSEGFASVAAAWLLADPVLLDSRASGVRAVDLEVMDDPRAFGTGDGTATGAISEFLVAAVLWDALDPANDDPIALPAEAVFQAALAGLATRTIDSGAPGMDLLDHAEALACRASPPIDALLEARAVPASVQCRAKARSLLTPVASGYVAGCTGMVETVAGAWWVERGALIETAGPARLRCGAIVEYADPPRAVTPVRWSGRGGAAQVD